MKPTTEEIVKSLRGCKAGTAGGCRDCLEELEAELTALKEQQRWIPVTERLPEDDEDVLALVSGDVSMGYFNIFRGYWVDYESDDDNVSHWMPLPEPPMEE